MTVSGVGQLKLTGATQGSNRDQLISHLGGITEFKVQNGVVEGMDLNYLITSADALLNKKTISRTHQC